MPPLKQGVGCALSSSYKRFSPKLFRAQSAISLSKRISVPKSLPQLEMMVGDGDSRDSSSEFENQESSLVDDMKAAGAEERAIHHGTRETPSDKLNFRGHSEGLESDTNPLEAPRDSIQSGDDVISDHASEAAGHWMPVEVDLAQKLFCHENRKRQQP
jgi:hypothetical protein